MTDDYPHWETTGPWKPLEAAVTDLAFHSHPDPPGQALTWLCKGVWKARGDWKWWAWVRAIYMTEQSGTIPSDRWTHLAEANAKGVTEWVSGKPLPTFGNGYSFPGKVPTFETAHFDWQNNASETALLIGPGEEWFCATNIEVAWTKADSSPTPPATETRNLGGRPPTWDWEAAALAMAGRHFVDVWKPATVADVVRALQDWAMQSGQDLPDATAKPHAKRIFEAI